MKTLMCRSLVEFSFVALLLLMGLTACSTGRVLDHTVNAKGVPVWVAEGSNILTSEKSGRRFHGVGSASMLGDFSLQTATADNRAKSEVVRILASYLDIISRDYLASGDARGDGYTQQMVSRQITHLIKTNFSGAQVLGHWQDKQSKIIYSIVELDLDQVQEILKEAEFLHQGFKRYMNREGNLIFDRIAKSEN